LVFLPRRRLGQRRPRTKKFRARSPFPDWDRGPNPALNFLKKRGGVAIFAFKTRPFSPFGGF